MAGLYDLFNPQHPSAEKCMHALRLTVAEVPRYRNAYPMEGGRIAVFTRMGGGNRATFVKEIEAMQSHPLYLYDEDMKYDTTYATFWFKAPEGFSAELWEDESPEQQMMRGLEAISGRKLT